MKKLQEDDDFVNDMKIKNKKILQIRKLIINNKNYWNTSS